MSVRSLFAFVSVLGLGTVVLQAEEQPLDDLLARELSRSSESETARAPVPGSSRDADIEALLSAVPSSAQNDASDRSEPAAVPSAPVDADMRAAEPDGAGMPRPAQPAAGERERSAASESIAENLSSHPSSVAYPEVMVRTDDSRFGGWIGVESGSDADMGYLFRLESDLGIADWPLFVSARGELSQLNWGDCSEYQRHVYGSHGYSYREYFDDYKDLKETRYGGNAVLLWDPLRGEDFRIYAGAGGVFESVKLEGSVTRTTVTHTSYGRHWRSGGYSHRYWRTSRSVSHHSESDSDNRAAAVLRGGISWMFDEGRKLSAEISHMPDLYEDSSETELRVAGFFPLSATLSFDVVFEYRLEAKTYVGGVGCSIWF